jgi:phosphate starvation-inducible PhoH-like protein
MGALCGEHNAHLQVLEEKAGVTLHVRGNHILLEGGDWEVELAENVLMQLHDLVKAPSIPMMWIMRYGS